LDIVGGAYGIVLIIHSWLRWAALALGIAATVNAFVNRSRHTSPIPGRRWDVLFMAAVDFQVLFGLALYFGLSPFTSEGFNDFRAALRNPGLRFWMVEHAAAMLTAVVLVRAGRVLAINAKTPDRQRLSRGICFALSVVAMAVGIPWPGLDNGRPLLRL
jgi:hypothetical protein